MRISTRIVATLVAVVMMAAALAFGSVGTTPSAVAEPGKSRLVSGWFGYWTSADEMIRVARESNGVLGEVNIFWWHYAGANKPVCTYTSDSCLTGSSTPWTTPHFNAATKGLQALGIDVYASHTDLSASHARSLSNYLSTSSNRKKLAKQLTEWVVLSGVNGLDLDWENFAFNDGRSTWAATQPRFVKMMKLLGSKLHAAGKKLSVTVPGGYAPFQDGKPNPGGGYEVYAWAEIAPHVDRLRLMTYDYSWNRPGPIGPHAWADDVAASAAAQVGTANRSKIYLGVHQYGKAWHQRDANDGYITSGDCRANWVPDAGNGVSMSPTSARSLATSYGVTPSYNSTHREWTYKYIKSEPGSYLNKSGKKHSQTCRVNKEVWFGDTETAVGRADIVKKHGIGGIAVWELSSPRSNFYPELSPYTKVSGQLTLTASSVRPATGERITLTGQTSGVGVGTKIKQQQKKSGGKWKTTATERTNASGQVRFTIQMGNKPKAARYRLKSQGLKSKSVKVRSQPPPSIRFRVKGREAGMTARFKGKVTPATAGQSVARQVKLDGTWRMVKTKQTNDKGKVKFRTKLLAQPQKYRHRLWVGPSSQTSGGTSKVVSFRSN